MHHGLRVVFGEIDGVVGGLWSEVMRRFGPDVLVPETEHVAELVAQHADGIESWLGRDVTVEDVYDPLLDRRVREERHRDRVSATVLTDDREQYFAELEIGVGVLILDVA